MTIPAGAFPPTAPSPGPVTFPVAPVAPAGPQPPAGQPYLPPAPVVDPNARTGYPPSQVPAAPAAAPVAPVAPAPVAPAGVTSETILTAAHGVPQELVGRRWADVVQMYTGLRDFYVQAQRGRPAAPVAPAAPTAAPVAPVAGATALPPWLQQVETVVSRIIDERMAPVTDAATRQQAQDARAQIAARYPDFNTYAPIIHQELGNADPAMLTDPRTWDAAYVYARGKVAAGLATLPAPAPAGPRVVPAPVTAHRPTDFFTESPSPPTPPPGGNGLTGISPIELAVAQKMGMTPEMYIAWKGGIPPQQGGAR